MNKKKISFPLFSIFGTVNTPPGLDAYPAIEAGGLAIFLGNIIKAIQVGGFVYALFNFVLAGLAYMSAGGDPKKIADASAKIWQTLIGIVLMLGAFVIGALLSNILYGDIYSMWWMPIYGPP